MHLFRDDIIARLFQDYLSFEQIKSMAAIIEKPEGSDTAEANNRMVKRQATLSMASSDFGRQNIA